MSEQTWQEIPLERKRVVWLSLLDDALEFAEFPVRTWADVAQHISGSYEALPDWIDQMEEVGFRAGEPVPTGGAN
jgi:hypothetical protein